MRFCERFNKTLAGEEFRPKKCASIQESNERKMESKRILTTKEFLFITIHKYINFYNSTPHPK